MILGLEAEEGAGKTTTAYTAPLKIVGFQFDLGSDRAINGVMWERMFKGLRIHTEPYGSKADPRELQEANDILIWELPAPIQIDSVRVQGCVDLWNYFLTRLGTTFQDPKVRSVVIDTMTLARRIKADAYLEALQNKDAGGSGKMRERLQEIEYAAPNGAIRDIFTGFSGAHMNLIATHHLMDERYETVRGDGQVIKAKTGKRVLEGLANTHRFVDVAVLMEKKKGQITGTFVKCGYNISLEGVTVTDPTWDVLAGMIEDSCGGRLKLERRQEA